ncbi:hypothetical protein SAMN02745687_02271 [Lachnospiraceae bacterium NK3A20]|nr:hypothetical protein SAMN02745687_02271 [Lachnospiraceae bacterium NK3A20]
MNEFLTDRELDELIADVETKGVLPAPASIRENVLMQIHRETKRKVRATLTVYSLKIMTVAAAVMILAFHPSQAAAFRNLSAQFGRTEQALGVFGASSSQAVNEVGRFTNDILRGDKR